MLQLTRQQALIVAAVALSNLAVCCWWLGTPGALVRLRDWWSARPGRLALLILLAAGTLWIGIFVVYGFPITGDVKSFYLPQGRAALAGQVPNADYTSWYMPVFSYLMGIVDRVGPGDLAIPLFMAICFVAGGLLLPRLSALAGVDPVAARALAPVAVLNGASWLLAIGYQQDEALMFFLTMAALLLLARGMDLSAGLVVGFGFLSTKVLFLLTAAALGLQARRRPRFVTGALSVVVPSLALFLLLGFEPVRMLRGAVGQWTPPSLATLIDVWPAAHSALGSNPWLNHLPVGACCLAMVLMFRRRGTGETAAGAVRAVVAVWLAYVVLSLNAPPTYRVLIVPFLPTLLESWQLPGRLKVPLFGLYCTVLGVQWMFFEDWVGRPYGSFLADPGTTAAGVARLTFQLALDSLVLGCEILWLALCFRSLRRRPGPEPLASP